jgi:hypothetical protein
MNVSSRGGTIYDTLHSKVIIDSSLIVDNGNTQDNKSGLIYLTQDAFSLDTTLQISNSNLYYNTFQPDTEISNNTNVAIQLEHNFWGDTTDVWISSLIEGPNDHTPWENDFIEGVPGEPISIDSVRNYTSDFLTEVTHLGQDPDTLYLRIYGEDRLNTIREAAVAIIKSSIYPTGIAVALIETDTNSGIYEGKSIVKTTTGNDTIRIDDIYQTIRVNPLTDTIQIVANIDTAKKFIVYYRKTGIEEFMEPHYSVSLQVCPNPSIGSTQIKYSLPTDSHINIAIYNLSGQKVATIVNKKTKAGCYNYKMESSSGIYFIKCSSEQKSFVSIVKKIIILK